MSGCFLSGKRKTFLRDVTQIVTPKFLHILHYTILSTRIIIKFASGVATPKSSRGWWFGELQSSFVAKCKSSRLNLNTRRIANLMLYIRFLSPMLYAFYVLVSYLLTRQVFFCTLRPCVNQNMKFLLTLASLFVVRVTVLFPLRYYRNLARKRRWETEQMLRYPTDCASYSYTVFRMLFLNALDHFCEGTTWNCFKNRLQSRR